jgi:hypothetical protein
VQRTPSPIAQLGRVARATALAAALLALGACGGDAGLAGSVGVGGPGPDDGEVTPPGTTPLVGGRWWRLETFVSGGDARTTETIWEFFSDGSARRTLISTNVDDGIAEALVFQARWRVEGREVVITYLPPSGGTVRFEWLVERFIDGEVLYLDRVAFTRVP